eukprot:scaffold21986_cov30-Tisochrysis_lutea.AAC.1
MNPEDEDNQTLHMSARAARPSRVYRHNLTVVSCASRGDDRVAGVGSDAFVALSEIPCGCPVRGPATSEVTGELDRSNMGEARSTRSLHAMKRTAAASSHTSNAGYRNGRSFFLRPVLLKARLDATSSRATREMASAR